MKIFDRQYQLIIGNYSTGDGVLIEDLNITFDIAKSADNKRKGHNTASFSVYNLTAQQREFAESRHITVQLNVRYGSSSVYVPMFKGEVTQAFSEKSGPDIVTSMECGDGFVALTTTKLKQVMPQGTSIGSVLEEIRSRMPNVARGSYTVVNLDSPISRSYRLSGTAREALDKLAKEYKLDYTIDGGILNVTDQAKPLFKNTETAPLISPSTGLIEIPYNTTEEARVTAKDKTRRDGIKFKCFLNPEIVCGSLVVLRDTTNNTDGFYRVNSLRHSGTYRGNDWLTEVMASRVDAEELT
ncbi:baseplate hub protein [Pseudomonas sp. p1(2021b)]|uniref:baseplate hub protein n=1 Tax=Pseudomonas sp. p1(2021b) TaxID=2874628 RepID=UPI003D2AA102